MKPMPLTHFLPVLDAHKARQIEAPRNDLHIVSSNPAPLHLPFEAPEPRVLPEVAAYELGLKEGREAAEADAEQSRRDEEERFAARLVVARAEWSREQGAPIASGIEKALGVIERGICEAAERILKQVIDTSMRERAMAEFAVSIRQLLQDGNAGVVTVHGPADLLVALQKHLGPLDALIEFNAHDDPEVWVRVDQTHIETRFAAWRSSLTLEG